MTRFRVESFKALRFKKFSEISITFPSQWAIQLIGLNGAGKSTIGDGIAAAIRGTDFCSKDNRFRLIKDGAQQAELSVVLVDDKTGKRMKIERILDAQGGIKLTANDGSQIFGEKDIKDFINAFALDPIGFSELPPDKQALALGIDTKELDKKYKIAYDQRRIENANVKQIQTVMERTDKPDKTAATPKDLLPIQAKIVGAEQSNADRLALVNNSNEARRVIEAAHGKIAELESLIIEQRNFIDKTEAVRETIEKQIEGKPEIDLTPLHAERDEIIAFNGGIQGNLDKIKAYDSLMAEYKEATKKQEFAQSCLDTVIAEKTAYVKAAKLPDGCTIDDTEGHEGELLYGGRPVNKDNYSMAERIKIGIELLLTLRKEDKDGIDLVFIQDASLLDEASMATLVELAEKNNITIMFEVVGDEATGEAEILVREHVKE